MTPAHPNDEQLSAYLDGELRQAASVVAPGVAFPAHLAACDACRLRLAALAGARDLVRLPVSLVPSSVRAAAVAAALSEGLSTGNGHRPAPADAPLPGPHWTRTTRLVAAAAAVALLAVTVGTALVLSHGRSGTATSATASHGPTTTGGNREPAALAPTAAPALGSVSSLGALRARLTPLLHSENDSAAATGAAPLTAGSQSATSASPSGGLKTAVSVPAELATCVAAAQRATSTADTVALVATVTYGRTPAVVVVVQVTGTPSTPEPPSLAVVMARSGCRVLARASL